jgi:hypothetical protein
MYRPQLSFSNARSNRDRSRGEFPWSAPDSCLQPIEKIGGLPFRQSWELDDIRLGSRKVGLGTKQTSEKKSSGLLLCCSPVSLRYNARDLTAYNLWAHYGKMERLTMR